MQNSRRWLLLAVAYALTPGPGCGRALGISEFKPQAEPAEPLASAAVTFTPPPPDAHRPPDGGGAGSAQPDANVATALLEVSVAGSGHVTSDPAGIDCPGACSAAFDLGTSVNLVAAPSASDGFAAWSGACSGISGSCTLVLAEPRAIVANFAPHGSKRWVKQLGLPGQDFLESRVVVDSQGNPIVAGIVEDIDDTWDLYVAKFDRQNGDLLWENRLVTPCGEYFGGLTVDADGEVYAAMTEYGLCEPFDLGGTTVSGDLFGDIVVVRLAATTGALRWAVGWAGNGQDRPIALAVSGVNLIVVGETSSTAVNFGGAVRAASSGSAFLVRANTANGSVNQALILSGSFDVRDVAVSGERLAIAGRFSANSSLGACSFARSTGTSFGFIAQFSTADLSCQWARSFSGATADSSAVVQALAFEPLAGGWVTTGSFQGSTLFAESGSYLESRGSSDVFAAGFSATGAHNWSFRYGAEGGDSGSGIAVSPDGAVLLAGMYAQSITIGSTTLNGFQDAFVTRLGASAPPVAQWSSSFGGDDVDSPTGLATDAEGHPYVLAYFRGMTSVGGVTLSAADYDAWLAALVP